ncbi:hypothetical protein ANME2D_01087 [Candidatus Methanoperedens nitroreducens]|uniref:ArnR1-like winged helix-turn-helix domain-containing protein n=2 Tax=Candidatus Methanoperedens nitratireducens TaxID=1392998 RepID=A0A062V0I3_9EURY|nr:hypothetical protein ANME2D_01087 [Candidatus Methanoperedens nitroreducens]
MLSVTLEEKKPKKTRIMRRTYLNCKSFNKYFDLLVEEDFIAMHNTEERSYVLTEKGKDLLRRLKELAEILPLNKMRL